MILRNSDHQKKITAADLYPDLTPEDQQQAVYFLSRYLALIERIFQRTQRNLTDSDISITM